MGKSVATSYISPSVGSSSNPLKRGVEVPENGDLKMADIDLKICSHFREIE